jgi:hypothetical protein
MAQPIQFQLEDERTGLRAIFIASPEEPGDVSVAIWDEAADAYRVPSETEIEAIESHPLSTRIRIDLVLESGRQWPNWRPYAQLMLGLLSQHASRGAS